MTEEVPLQEETYWMLGACFEVYSEMGAVFSSRSIRSVWESNWSSGKSLSRAGRSSENQHDQALEVDSS